MPKADGLLSSLITFSYRSKNMTLIVLLGYGSLKRMLALHYWMLCMVIFTLVPCKLIRLYQPPQAQRPTNSCVPEYGSISHES